MQCTRRTHVDNLQGYKMINKATQKGWYITQRTCFNLIIQVAENFVRFMIGFKTTPMSDHR